MTLAPVRPAHDGTAAHDDHGEPGSSNLWLTAMVFDGPYPEAGGFAGTVESALAVDHSADAGLAAGLAVRWDLGDPRPRQLHLPTRKDTDALLELIFTGTFLLPLVSAATQSPAAVADNPALRALGIDVTFANRLQDAVVPGRWALVLLATRDQDDELADLLAQPRPRVRSSTRLTDAQVNAVREVYGPEPV